MRARGEDPAWLVWLSLLGLVLLLGGVFVSLPRIAALLPKPEAPDARIERELLSSPEGGPLYRTIKRAYPEEFRKLVADAAAHVEFGQLSDEGASVLEQDLLDAQRRHQKDLIQAPHADFAAYRAARIKFLTSLRALAPDLCARFERAGTIHSEEGSDGVHATVFDFNTATWASLAAGREHPTNRAVREPSNDDFRRIDAALVEAGFSRMQIDGFYKGQQAELLSDADQCDIALDFHRAVDALPGDRADAYFAWLVANGN